MSFVLAKRPVAATPIKASVYDADGNAVEISFIAQYRRIKHSEFVDLQDGLHNRVMSARGEKLLEREDETAPVWKYKSDREFINDVMVGWPGVKDEAGEDVVFSVDALNELIDHYPELVVPLFGGFFDAHRGARIKN